MKFHQLARHNQLFGASNLQRSVSPIKNVQQNSSNHSLQQQQQMAAAQLLQQQHHLNNSQSMTDDEDEEFNGDNPLSFYDSVVAEQQQHQNQLSGQLVPAGAMNSSEHANQLQTNTVLDSNGFLIDKNKKLFPQKLWELIHNPSIQHCLRWSQDGQRVYLNRNEFETYYLKTPNNQFHTQKAISFVRQMNMYGFRKVDDCYYENDNFRRDQQHLLKNMIRRHPNKALFAGLDQHQLAAAAAAQQALQVNHQLQQLEHQHKHRAEQALRLNNYLNSHQFHHHQQQQQQHQLQHQLHQTNLAHQQHLKHSLPFDQMSSQLARAVNQLSQQQQQQQQQQQGQQMNLHQLGENLVLDQDNCSTNFEQAVHQLSGKVENLNQLGGSTGSGTQMNHQPKKSRLLNNFYASNNIDGGSNNNNTINSKSNPFAEQQNPLCSKNNSNNQIVSSHDSMHSNSSSVDTQPSQCSSSVNSGSAGSPQPNSPQVNLKDLARSGRIDDYKLADAINLNEQLAQQMIGTDLTSHSMAARQAALHQTLVRSLLQLKHGQQHNNINKNNNNHHHHHHYHQQHRSQDLIASIQQQQRDSRTLLESLASLSSAGTGSMVDPTSNSPTERTSTPPSGPASPTSALDVVKCDELGIYNGTETPIALNLAKSSSNDRMLAHHNEHSDGRDEAQVADGDDTKLTEENLVEVHGAGSPLDAAKKVRKFLEDHMIHNDELLPDEEVIDCKSKISKIKLENYSNESDDSHRPKRLKALHDDQSGDERNDDNVLMSLISGICKRRGIQLHQTALNEATRYTERFLDILLDDASLIANHSQEANEKTVTDNNREFGHKDAMDIEKSIDTSSLALAFKLIPSKLLSSVQQQQVSSKSIIDEEIDD